MDSLNKGKIIAILLLIFCTNNVGAKEKVKMVDLTERLVGNDIDENNKSNTYVSRILNKKKSKGKKISISLKNEIIKDGILVLIGTIGGVFGKGYYDKNFGEYHDYEKQIDNLNGQITKLEKSTKKIDKDKIQAIDECNDTKLKLKVAEQNLNELNQNIEQFEENKKSFVKEETKDLLAKIECLQEKLNEKDAKLKSNNNLDQTIKEIKEKTAFYLLLEESKGVKGIDSISSSEDKFLNKEKLHNELIGYICNLLELDTNTSNLLKNIKYELEVKKDDNNTYIFEGHCDDIQDECIYETKNQEECKFKMIIKKTPDLEDFVYNPFKH